MMTLCLWTLTTCALDLLHVVEDMEIHLQIKDVDVVMQVLREVTIALRGTMDAIIAESKDTGHVIVIRSNAISVEGA